MRTIMKELVTPAPLDAVWDAMRAVGELHTRLVPGFATDTALDGDVRVVTFADGSVAREPIVSVSDELRRVVWTIEGGASTHYNGAAQAIASDDGTRVMWIVDFLPEDLREHLDAAMTAGMRSMRLALDRLDG